MSTRFSPRIASLQESSGCPAPLEDYHAQGSYARWVEFITADMEEKMNKRVCILVAFAVVASPIYAADNCFGEFAFQPTGNSPGDISVGKISTWTSASSVSSDNTPYNG